MPSRPAWLSRTPRTLASFPERLLASVRAAAERSTKCVTETIAAPICATLEALLASTRPVLASGWVGDRPAVGPAAPERTRAHQAAREQRRTHRAAAGALDCSGSLEMVWIGRECSVSPGNALYRSGMIWMALECPGPF